MDFETHMCNWTIGRDFLGYDTDYFILEGN